MKTRLFLVLAFTLLSPSPGHGATVQEELPYRGEPNEKMIIVVNKGIIKQYRAALKKTPKTLTLTAEVEQLEPGSLLSGVVVLADGSMVSTPLHYHGEPRIGEESQFLRREKQQQLEEALALNQKRVSQLEDEIQALNTKLRKAAGLSDVDGMYERIRQIEQNIEQLTKASKDAEDTLTGKNQENAE